MSAILESVEVEGDVVPVAPANGCEQVELELIEEDKPESRRRSSRIILRYLSVSGEADC